MSEIKTLEEEIRGLLGRVADCAHHLADIGDRPRAPRRPFIFRFTSPQKGGE